MHDEIKNEIPNCLKDRISFKSVTLHSLNTIIEHCNENGNDFQILLLTPYGFIKGDISDFGNKENFVSKTNVENKFDIDFSYIINSRDDYMSELEKDNPNIKPIDNGAVLNLKNVTIYKNDLANPVLTINQYMVFVDQIIGFYPIYRNLQPN